jgi:nucleotide-binding universal stress UspA family protein
MHLKKLLVPIDFSKGSLTTARHAGALARRFHSEVTLLHVQEFTLHSLSGPLGQGITSWEALRAEHSAARQKQLDDFATGELAGFTVRRRTCGGDPASAIVKCAREEASDLILMPTHGGGAFRQFLLGSVTAKVIHDADCPVWTGAHVVETPASDPDQVHHVMCAVDFGVESTKTIQWAAAFAAEFGAKLTAVHSVSGTPPNLPDRYAFQWHQESHAGTEERLRVLLIDSGVHADALVLGDNDIPRVLSAAAKEKAADLLVIGRSCGQPKRPGSHTYAIICNSPCPVVSV